MIRKQKNDRICPICGRKFRLERKRGRHRKYCSDKCYKIAHRMRVDHRVNLGTPNTLSLTPKSVSYQLFLIRNNIDNDAKNFISDKSEREVILDRMVYNEDGSIIREV